MPIKSSIRTVSGLFFLCPSAPYTERLAGGSPVVFGSPDQVDRPPSGLVRKGLRGLSTVTKFTLTAHLKDMLCYLVNG